MTEKELDQIWEESGAARIFENKWYDEDFDTCRDAFEAKVLSLGGQSLALPREGREGSESPNLEELRKIMEPLGVDVFIHPLFKDHWHEIEDVFLLFKKEN